MSMWAVKCRESNPLKLNPATQRTVERRQGLQGDQLHGVYEAPERAGSTHQLSFEQGLVQTWPYSLMAPVVKV